MPSWAIQIPAAAAVIYVVVFTIPKFLKALEDMGTRWDAERKQARQDAEADRARFAELLEKKELAWAAERSRSQEALMATIALVHKMVDNCQNMVPPSERISSDEVCAAVRIQSKHS